MNNTDIPLTNVVISLAVIVQVFHDWKAQAGIMQGLKPTVYWNIDGGPWKKPEFVWRHENPAHLPQCIGEQMSFPSLAPHSQHSLGFWLSVPDGTLPAWFSMSPQFWTPACDAWLRGGSVSISYSPNEQPKLQQPKAPAVPTDLASITQASGSPSAAPSLVPADVMSALPGAVDHPVANPAVGWVVKVGGLAAVALLAAVAGLRAWRARRT